MRIIRLILAMTAMLVYFAGWAQHVEALYSRSELQSWSDRYRPNLEGLWQHDFLSRLTTDERQRAGEVRLVLPLHGPSRQPLEFYSSPAHKQVFIPIASVKFIDDLSVAFAFYEKSACDLATVSDYASAFHFRPHAVAGHPLDVLGVPGNALSDPVVDDVAQKMLKSIIYFVVAHEYAHVMYAHRVGQTVSALQSQRQEIEADAFALEAMRRIGVAPIALPFLFLVTSRLEKTPGDFASAHDYERYLQQEATHPLSAMRVAHLANGIEAHAAAFARLQKNSDDMKRRLRSAVQQLRIIAANLDDPRLRDWLKARAATIDVASLRMRCKP